MRTRLSPARLERPSVSFLVPLRTMSSDTRRGDVSCAGMELFRRVKMLDRALGWEPGASVPRGKRDEIVLLCPRDPLRGPMKAVRCEREK